MRFFTRARQTKRLHEQVAQRTYRSIHFLALALVLGGLGCEPTDTPPPNTTTRSPAAPRIRTVTQTVKPAATEIATSTVEHNRKPTPADRKPSTVPLPWNDGNLPIEQPIVLMSEHHRNQCRVFVDDRFPDLTVTTPDRSPAILDSQIQDRLAVVLFWNRKHKMSVEAAKRIEETVLAPFENLTFVAIHVDDDAASIEQIEQSVMPTTQRIELRAKLDQVESAIGKGLLPRTYLVRADGTIAWLDGDYGRSTRRGLRNAILYSQENVSNVATVKPLTQSH